VPNKLISFHTFEEVDQMADNTSCLNIKADWLINEFIDRLK